LTSTGGAQPCGGDGCAAPLTVAGMTHDIEAICALGNRFVSTPGEAAARELMLAEFAAAGLQEVRTEDVDLLAYVPKSARCEAEGLDEDIAVSGLQMTASATVEGEGLYLGAPRSWAEVEQAAAHLPPLRERVVVLDSSPSPFIIELIAAGVRAVVQICQAPDGIVQHFCAGPYPYEGPHCSGPLPIPGVAVEAAAGRRLVSLLSGGPRSVRVTHQASYVPWQSANVVGTKPGNEEEEILVGAHYDTQMAGPGANDNATGLAALLGMARSWSSVRHHRRITFVSFCGHELGLWGSSAYCRRHQAAMAGVRGMVNIDALAWLYPGRRTLLADPSATEYAIARAAERDWVVDNVIDVSAHPEGDVNPFIDAGVPGCWFWRMPPQHPYYHSSRDEIELLDMALVTDTANLTAHLVHALAEDRELALGRSRPTVSWRGSQSPSPA